MGKSYDNVDFQRLTQTQMAVAHSADPRTLRRWIELGLPRNQDGTFSLPATIVWRAAKTNARGQIDVEGIRNGWT